MVIHLPWFCSCVEYISSQWRSVPVALVSVCRSNQGRQSYVASVWMKGSHVSSPTDQPFFDTLAPYESPGSLWQTQCPTGSTEPDVYIGSMGHICPRRSLPNTTTLHYQ